MRVQLRRVLVAALPSFSGGSSMPQSRWVGEAGGIGNAFDHLYRTLRYDWMAQIVVSDHLVIAGTVLVALWIDAGRLGWGTGRRIFLALGLHRPGIPALLAYLAWRLGRGSEGTTAG